MDSQQESSAKITSALVKGPTKETIRQTYEAIWQQGKVWARESFVGKHTLVVGALKEELPGKRVLDVGCGGGRLPIMCAEYARAVDGIDFSAEAIAMAQRLYELTPLQNVRFFVADIDSYTDPEGYDIITLTGVLEHVEDPLHALRRIRGLLQGDGLLVVECPNFLNFRGDVYMTLLKLLELPMSLADLRQVDYTHIRSWAAETGFRLEKTIGYLYGFGWTDKAITDMIKRVPLAFRDKALDIPVHFEAFNAWMRSRLEVNRQLLNDWIQQGYLQPIRRQTNIRLRQNDDVPEAIWQQMSQYFDDPFEDDPYYSDVLPYSLLGGGGIYFLRSG